MNLASAFLERRIKIIKEIEKNTNNFWTVRVGFVSNGEKDLTKK